MVEATDVPTGLPVNERKNCTFPEIGYQVFIFLGLVT